MTPPRVRAPFLFALATLLLCAGAAGCGGGGGKVATAASHSVSPKHLVRDADEDHDDASGRYYDLDDDPILDYGHLAGPVEAAAVGRMVAGFYADAAADDGAAVCPLLYSVVAESLPEQYESPSGSQAAYGTTCATVLTHVFARDHRVYAERHATLQVTSVRVEGEQGFALLRFGEKTARDEHLRLHREGGVWKLHELLDEGLP